MNLAAALKSRTIRFAIALAVLSVIQGYLGVFHLTPVTEMLAGIVISVAVAVLRFVTTQPIGSK